MSARATALTGRRASYACIMQSGLAERVLAELAFTPDLALCLRCIALRLDFDLWGVGEAIKELIESGAILSVFTMCADCGEREVVARVRQKPW